MTKHLQQRLAQTGPGTFTELVALTQDKACPLLKSTFLHRGDWR